MSREEHPGGLLNTQPVNFFSDEPQPLSPARRQVSFRAPVNRPSPDEYNGETATQMPDKTSSRHSPSKNYTRSADVQRDTSTPRGDNHIIDNLSGREFLVNPSPKPKRKPKLKHFYDSPRVYVRTVFMKIGEVDTVKEQFNAEIFVQARWREPALDSNHPKKAEVNWKEIWNPGLVIQNTLGTDVEKTWYEMEVTNLGEVFVVERRRVKGTFAESMELQNFPFDTQCLSLVLTSEDRDVELVEDSREPNLVRQLGFVDEQEWHIRELVECVPGVNANGELGNLLPSPSVLLVRIYASRRAGFFFWNILAITSLICSLVLCTFSVSRDHPTNRLQLSFTTVLTVVAFKFVSNQNIPKISYLTVLDKYILTSMILMHLVCVWHSIICLFPMNSTTDALDVAAFVVCTLAFVLVQIVFYVSVSRSIRGERMVLLQLERQYKEKVNRLMGAGFFDESKRKGQRKFLPNSSVGTL